MEIVVNYIWKQDFFYFKIAHVRKQELFKSDAFFFVDSGLIKRNDELIDYSSVIKYID